MSKLGGVFFGSQFKTNQQKHLMVTRDEMQPLYPGHCEAPSHRNDAPVEEIVCAGEKLVMLELQVLFLGG